LKFVTALGQRGTDVLVNLLIVEEGLLAESHFEVHEVESIGVELLGWELLVSVDG
jgi:hypothetical protein